jgi:hypothetical protein
MDRRSAYVLLAVIGAGVFLAGLELMVTAVALPSIIEDLADPDRGSAWVELRKASWIINGYLLVYILTMPLAGRLSDIWGVRRLFMGALAVFTFGSALCGAAQTMDQLIAARLVQAVGGGVLVPVGTAAAAHLFAGAARPRALGVVGALTFLGMAAGPVVGAAIIGSVHASDALEAAGITGLLAAMLEPAWAMGLLPQHPDRHLRARARLGGLPRLGLAAPPRTDRPYRRGLVRDRARDRADRADPARLDGHRGQSGRSDRHHGRAPRGRRRGLGDRDRARPARRGSLPRSAAVPERPVQLGDAGVAPHRLRVRDGHHRWRRVRGPRALRRARRSGPRARGARGCQRSRCAAFGSRGPGLASSGDRRRRARAEHRRAGRDVDVDARDEPRVPSRSRSASSGWASG